jgi:general nucleoside transport system permease protein
VRLKTQRRPPLPWWGTLLFPIGAVLLSFLLSSILILWAQANPIQAWYQIFAGSLGRLFSFLQTMVKMAPLVFTGLAVAVAFRARFWNIGAEGQLYAGALAAAAIGVLPFGGNQVLHLTVILMGGFLAGGLWGSIPGYLKAKFGVDDVVTTLLSNYIIIYLLQALLEGVWRDPVSNWPHSPPIQESAHFPILVARSRFHLGIILAGIVVIIVYLFLEKTILGYQINAVGMNPKAAKFGGISTTSVTIKAALISGGIAGLAGVGEVCGIHHYLISDLSPGYGYYGIAVAMLGELNALGVLLSAFYFAIIINGSKIMSMVTGVPVYLGDVLLGITLLTMLVALWFQRYQIKIER